MLPLNQVGRVSSKVVSPLLFQNVSKQAALTARHEVLRSLIKNP